MADQLIITDAQLLSNDEGLGLLVLSVGSAAAGRVERIDGGVLYTAPDTGSTDTFTYRIRDAFGATATATVTVNLIDASVVVARDNVYAEPIDCGTAVTLTHAELLANDTGETPLSVTNVSNAVNGNAMLEANTVTFTAEDCAALAIRKTFVAPRRFVAGTFDANGVIQVAGLFADANNISGLDEGDFAVLSMLRCGSSPLEPGWTPLAQSAQAGLFYRRLDQAYIDLHKSPTYAGDSAVPYPYLTTRADNALPLSQITVETFAVPAGVPPTIDDLFLLKFADTKEDGGTWNWKPQGFDKDYYRRVYIDAFDPTGINGGGTTTPTNDLATTTQSTEDSLNNRKAIYDGNRLIYSIAGDTYGFRRGDFDGSTSTSFSEGGSLSNISNVYAVAYAIRSQPQAGATVGGEFTYTASDENGSTDSAKVVLPILAPTVTDFTRFRQVAIRINGDGVTGTRIPLQPNNFRIGVHCKSYESQYVTNSSLDQPLDPEPGWTLLNKTGPHDYVAGTIAYQRFVPNTSASSTDANEIYAFRYMGGLPPTSSMAGIEIVADPGEEWEDIFVSSQAVAASIPAADSPYICPRLPIPEGCCSLTVMTARSYTALVEVSGGDAAVRMFHRYDFLGMTTWIIQSTTVAPQIVVRRHPSSTRATLDVGTFTMVFNNRKNPPLSF